MDYMKEVLEQFVGSIPAQTKANVDAKLHFEEDNNALINIFTELGITIKDENGNFRLTKDVLKDMSKKYEQLKD